MAHCHTCGSFVSADFARVFGSNENEIYACPDCASFVDIADLAAGGTRPGDVGVAGT